MVLCPGGVEEYVRAEKVLITHNAGSFMRICESGKLWKSTGRCRA